MGRLGREEGRELRELLSEKPNRCVCDPDDLQPEVGVCRSHFLFSVAAERRAIPPASNRMLVLGQWFSFVYRFNQCDYGLSYNARPPELRQAMANLPRTFPWERWPGQRP